MNKYWGTMTLQTVPYQYYRQFHITKFVPYVIVMQYQGYHLLKLLAQQRNRRNLTEAEVNARRERRNQRERASNFL